MKDTLSTIFFLFMMVLFFRISIEIYSGEQEGSIKNPNSCIRQIELEEDSKRKFFNKFTCQKYVTLNGRNIAYFCGNVELNDYGVCTELLWYSKESEVIKDD